MGYYGAPPIPRDQLAHTGLGFTTESFDSGVLTAGAAPASQAVYATRVGLRATDVVTNIIIGVWVAGAGTAPTSIRLGLLDSTYKILARTANLASDVMWTSAGKKQAALTTPYTISSSGLYYCAFLQDGTWGTTAMQFARINGNTLGGVGSSPFTHGAALSVTDAGFTVDTVLSIGTTTANVWMAVN